MKCNLGKILLPFGESDLLFGIGCNIPMQLNNAEVRFLKGDMNYVRN